MVLPGEIARGVFVQPFVEIIFKQPADAQGDNRIHGYAEEWRVSHDEENRTMEPS